MDRADTTGQIDRGQVVEWAPFELADGASEADLLKASAALQSDFLDRQPGFVRRELLKGKDGKWVDLVYWSNREAAERAVQEAAASPACHRYFQLMREADHADPGAGVVHLERAMTYPALPVAS
ncbi:MAG: hypothetical protein AB1451_03150 [Nitrospirota bacterium]